MKKRSEETRFIGLVFIIWKVTTLVIIYLASLILPYRAGYDFTHFLFNSSHSPVINNPVLGPLANFDGVHYLSIALDGYTTDGRYFPLYPLLIRIVSSSFGPRSAELFFVISVLITNISSYLSLFYLYKLIRLDYSQKIAKLSIFLLAIFPSSFFFGVIYPESLFLLLAVLAFYFARQGKWPWVILFASCLAATRIVGILIVPALIYEYFKQNPGRLRFKSLMFFLPFSALVIYSLYNFIVWHDWFYFIHNQGGLANGRSTSGIIFFGQTAFRYLKILIYTNWSFEWWVSLLELGSFLLGVFSIYLIFKKRLSMMYLIYSVLVFLLPISSGTFTGLPRYLSIIFPMFIALALVKNKLYLVVYVTLSILIWGLLLALFARGYYIA